MKPDEESAKVILMFSVYDLKARAYMAPFTAVTPGVALREFARAVQQERSPFAQFPADFALHQVGWFNEATGQCSSPTPPIPLAMATEFAVDSKVRSMGLDPVKVVPDGVKIGG